MNRTRAVVSVAVAVFAIAVVAAVAGAGTSAVGPRPVTMVLTAADLGRGAVVESQGFTRSGPIAASRGYQRSFTGVTLGKAHVFTLQDTVLIGKAPAEAAKLISSILLATSSKAGRDALYVQSEQSFAKSSKLTVRGGAVTRAGALKAGDAAVEIVFRFNTTKGSFQVGEVFVRVDGTLSTIYYGAGTPGLTQAAARKLALDAARRMQEAAATA